MGMPFFGGFSRPAVGAPMGGGFGSGCGGCAGGLIGLVLAALLIAVLTTSLSTCGGSYGPSYGGASYSQSASEGSATVREKLPASAVSKTDWYTDADGDWIHNASALTRGLEEFYGRTGVQPYVYILPNGETTSGSELAQAAGELYPELFSDEGHLLLVFCDDGHGAFNCGYCVGTDASSVVDSEALTILKDELSDAYNHAESDEEVFSDAFSKTAERIMAAAEEEKLRHATMLLVGIVILVNVIGLGVVYVVRKRKAQQEEKQKQMEDILNTPLEKFGDQSVEDLADKYEKDGPVSGDRD